MNRLAASHIAKSVRGLLALTTFIGASHAFADCASGPVGQALSPSRGMEALMNSRLGCSRDRAGHGVANPQNNLNPPISLASNHLISTEISPERHAPAWSALGAASASGIAAKQSRDPELETRVNQSMAQVQWADARDWIHNPPDWLKAAKDYRRHGMPIVHLMQSERTLVAIGVSNHGKPGLYFVSKLPF